MPRKDRSAARDATEEAAWERVIDNDRADADVDTYADAAVDVAVNVTDRADNRVNSRKRRRADEERERVTYRILPSVNTAFKAWCDKHKYVYGPTLEDAMRLLMQTENGEMK